MWNLKNESISLEEVNNSLKDDDEISSTPPVVKSYPDTLSCCDYTCGTEETTEFVWDCLYLKTMKIFQICYLKFFFQYGLNLSS